MRRSFILVLLPVLGCQDGLRVGAQNPPVGNNPDSQPPPGRIVVSPASVDFGAPIVGLISSPHTLTVRNEGSETVTIASTAITGTDASAFQLAARDNTCLGMKLAPGARCTLAARLAPLGAGPVRARLTVATLGGGLASAALAGTPAGLSVSPAHAELSRACATGVELVVTNDSDGDSGLVAIDVDPPFLVKSACTTLKAHGSCRATVGLAVTYVPPATSVQLRVAASPGGMVAVPLAITDSPGSLELDPGSHDFGRVSVNAASPPVTFTVRNTQSSAVPVTVSLVQGPFVITRSTCQTVPACGSCEVDVVFQPGQPGPARAPLQVSGGGMVATADLTGTGSIPAVLTIDPAVQELGCQLVGTPAPTTLTVTNTGGDDTAPLATTASVPALGVPTDGCQGLRLPPGASCAIQVEAAGATAGEQSATITVAEEGATSGVATTISWVTVPEPLLTVSGDGGFGPIKVASASQARAFAVTNASTQTFRVISALVLGANRADFITDNTCQAVLPGGQCSVYASFHPQKAGLRAGCLVVGAAGATGHATISGTGL